MKYEHMMPAVFQSRPNRFIAYAKIGNLQVTCHVKNTGRCRELLVPGAPLFLQHHPNAAALGRKTEDRESASVRKPITVPFDQMDSQRLPSGRANDGPRSQGNLPSGKSASGIPVLIGL